MKIQGLAVIAIIIILPMTIILTAYTSNQIKTLDLQLSYDSKLTNATYDAIKAFQLNMSNSGTSNIVDSKMRDIKASVNTFYNSLSSNFNMAGYGKDVLQEYVPAIVYTLYDGYYIYSEYTNTLDENLTADATYKNDDDIYGLKPYIYYTCRYKYNDSDNDSDFVINYSLDSYITIQGIINGKAVNESGYLLSSASYNNGNDEAKYRNYIIDQEQGLKQNVYVKSEVEGTGTLQTTIYNANTNKELICKKSNGAKYYYDDSAPSTNISKVFTYVNNDKQYQRDKSYEDININKNAVEYYKQAAEFKNKILNEYGLKELKSSHAVDQNGNPYQEDVMYQDYYIFKELENNLDKTQIEDENSQFNAHKIQVIKNSIESNLVVAISNYNKVSSVETNFAMPKLNDEEWENITKNISMITFLQGLNIGGKIYSGYSIVPNNSNEDYVSESDIYIIGLDGYYHNPTEEDLVVNSDCVGILKADFERRTFLDSDGNTVYFYPRNESASYKSVVNPNGVSSRSINEYFNTSDSTIRYIGKLYYTALGRERYGMYRVNNPYTY